MDAWACACAPVQNVHWLLDDPPSPWLLRGWPFVYTARAIMHLCRVVCRAACAAVQHERGGGTTSWGARPPPRPGTPRSLLHSQAVHPAGSCAQFPPLAANGLQGRLHTHPTAPPPHARVPACPQNALVVPIMRHQRMALAWMCKREMGSNPQGGILADDQGLGERLVPTGVGHTRPSHSCACPEHAACCLGD